MNEDFHKETVHLRFGQGIGAFLLNGVLRGKDKEQILHGMSGATYGNLSLFHGLQ